MIVLGADTHKRSHTIAAVVAVTGERGRRRPDPPQPGRARVNVYRGGDSPRPAATVARSAPAPDHLDGGAGNDNVDGGFGDDVLIGGPGRDTISGDLAGGDCGPLWCKYPFGNDTIEARDGEVDSITCGAGTDTVNADAQDIIAPDCENVVRGGAAAGSHSGGGAGAKAGAAKVTLKGRTRLAKALRKGFTVRVSGVKAGQRITLTARSGKKVVARGKATVARGATAVSVRLRFSTAGRKALKRKATLVVRGGTVAGLVTLRR